MASVLQVITAIERIANAAVDIARIVTHRLGHPPGAGGRPVRGRGGVPPRPHPGGVTPRPPTAGRPRAAGGDRHARHGHPPRAGTGSSTRSTATRSSSPATCSSARARRPASPVSGSWPGASAWEPAMVPDGAVLTDLDRAVDMLVEMKNISEAAVGLAYSALVLGDHSLAAGGPPPGGPARRDEGPPRAVGAAGRRAPTSTRHRYGACWHLSQAAEDIGDQAQQMVWLIEQKEEIHPILGIALGESDEVVAPRPGGPGLRPPTGPRSASSELDIEPGFQCWPSAGTAATSTNPAGTSTSRPATSSSPPAPTRVARLWPSASAGASPRTRRPASTSSSPSTGSADLGGRQM